MNPVSTVSCLTKKKYFHSREEAETWEKQNREKYSGTIEQHASACEDCDGFHLSTYDPVSYATSRSSMAQLEEKATRVKNHRMTSEEYTTRYAYVRSVLAQKPDISKGELARFCCKEWGVKENAAYQFLYNHLDRIKRGGEFVRDQGEAVATESLETIASRRKILEEELKKLEDKEQKILEAKELKLSPCLDGKGVLIKQEQNQIALLLEDAKQLVQKLTVYLAEKDLSEENQLN